MAGEENLFEQAVAAARQKDLATARILLKQLLKQEPQNLNAWLLGAHIVESKADAIRCYERVLTIDPNHAYAKQKLAELRALTPEAPAAPPAPLSTNTANKGTPAWPIPAQPEPEIIKPAPVNKSDKTRRDITIGLIGVLVVCCLGALVVAALPNMTRSQVVEVTPTAKELFDVIYHNARAGNNENIDDYMSTIHPGSAAALTTRAALGLVFSQYDLNFYFYDLSVISASVDEAKIHFSLETRKLKGPDFADNIVTGTMTLRRDNGEWKIYSQEAENTQYK
jgi:hypothetical protein